MSGGSSLALGSPEYKERQRDLQGIDEKTQERVKRADAGLIKINEIKNYDKTHKALSELNEKIPEMLRLVKSRETQKRMSPTQRKVSHEILKMSVQDEIEKQGRKQALETETKEDDDKIKRRLPKLLKSQVYNEGVSYDDFYPGKNTIEKYL